MEIITSHANLDLDGFASMVLAKKLYPNALITFSGNLSKTVKSIATLYHDKFDFYKAKDIDSRDINKLIIVDTSDLERIDKLGKNLKKDIEIVIYDHHKQSKESVYYKPYGANVTNLLEHIIKKDIKINNHEATIALMGIYEDTGYFTFDTTTPKDLAMASYLLDNGANLSLVNEYVKKSLSKKEIDILLEFLENGNIINKNGYQIFISSIKSKHFFRGLDSIINKIMELENFAAAFLIYGSFDKTSIIARSSLKTFDISKIIKNFGGNGHYCAASAATHDITHNDIMEKLFFLINNTEISVMKAKDIMQSPIKTVEEDFKIKDIYKLMKRFGYNGMPVAIGKEIKGIISRRDIDRAMIHGFANAPASAYMTRSVVTANIDDSIDYVKGLIIQNEIGRIPILDNNQLVGIITRSDILRSIYKENKNLENKKFEKKIDKVNIDLSSLPKDVLNIFNEFSNIADHRNEKIYLVGGMVRDLILGINNLDIDIVVEGDATYFAKDAFIKLKAQDLVIHDKFKTAILIINDNLKIDIASSRIEYYEYPTQLPNVEFGSIEQDLYRRDFSINAMALSLCKGNFGEILDYYKGYEDIKDKSIKVLHNLSFIEDPTRIIRIIRFAARLDFSIASDTQNFMINAINEGFLDKISWPRVKKEIFKILKEENPLKAIDLMFKFNIIKSIHPSIIKKDKLKKDLINIQNNRDYIINHGAKIWIVFLLAMLEELNKSELDFVLNRFRFSQKFIDKYDYGVNMRNRIINSLNASENNSEIYKILSPLPKEVIFLIYCLGQSKIKNRINNYLENTLKQKPIITGESLIKIGFIPSNKFKHILNYAYMVQLDNREYTADDIIKKIEEMYDVE